MIICVKTVMVFAHFTEASLISPLIRSSSYGISGQWSLVKKLVVTGYRQTDQRGFTNKNVEFGIKLEIKMFPTL